MPKPTKEASATQAVTKRFQASRKPGLTRLSGGEDGSVPDLKRSRAGEPTWHQHMQLEIGVKIAR
jgi:hypothetical protein